MTGATVLEVEAVDTTSSSLFVRIKAKDEEAPAEVLAFVRTARASLVQRLWLTGC